MLWISGLRHFVIHFGDGFAHERSLEFETVCVVDDAIEYGVDERRFADDVVLRFDGQLAGDHG